MVLIMIYQVSNKATSMHLCLMFDSIIGQVIVFIKDIEKTFAGMQPVYSLAYFIVTHYIAHKQVKKN